MWSRSYRRWGIDNVTPGISTPLLFDDEVIFVDGQFWPVGFSTLSSGSRGGTRCRFVKPSSPRFNSHTIIYWERSFTFYKHTLRYTIFFETLVFCTQRIILDWQETIGFLTFNVLTHHFLLEILTKVRFHFCSSCVKHEGETRIENLFL